MTDSKHSSPDPSLTAQGIPDSNFLYGWWRTRDQANDRLYRKAAYKALNIPEDNDGEVNANRTYNGLGLKELAVLGLTGLGITWMVTDALKPDPNTPEPIPQTQPAAEDYVSEFEWEAKVNSYE